MGTVYAHRCTHIRPVAPNRLIATSKVVFLGPPGGKKGGSRAQRLVCPLESEHEIISYLRRPAQTRPPASKKMRTTTRIDLDPLWTSRTAYLSQKSNFSVPFSSYSTYIIASWFTCVQSMIELKVMENSASRALGVDLIQFYSRKSLPGAMVSPRNMWADASWSGLKPDFWEKLK